MSGTHPVCTLLHLLCLLRDPLGLVPPAIGVEGDGGRSAMSYGAVEEGDALQSINDNGMCRLGM